MAKKLFIVCMRDEHMRLIGPFENADALRQYAANNNPSDDPRWQSIELDTEDFCVEQSPGGVDVDYIVSCHSPDAGPMPA